MSANNLIIEGVRQNNLRDLSLEIPHNRIVVITGVSGSGKSSLAIDTIFAEGQWRFIESLSSYARLFLEKLDRPDVDSLRNVRPAVALEQRNPVRGSRTTVGSATELNDLFRLLFSRIGRAVCPGCGDPLRSWHPEAVVEDLLEHHGEARAYILFFPHLADTAALQRRGFVRFFQGGRMVAPEESVPDSPLGVVVDRVVIRAGDRGRLTDSVETAWRHGDGSVAIHVVDGPEKRYSGAVRCSRCDRDLPEPHPLLFSSNHPLGACPGCKGFGNLLEYDPELIVPDPSLSLARGAIEPWQKPAYRPWYGEFLDQCGTRGIDIRAPFEALPEPQRDLILNGDDDFYGVNTFFAELEGKKYRLHVRVFLSRYRSTRRCPDCGGGRLRPEALLYRINGRTFPEIDGLSLAELNGWISSLELSTGERSTAADVLGRIGERLGFLMRVGLGYLSMNRQERSLSGGEIQRVRLLNQLAARLTGTLYVLDEPTVGLHPRDTGRICDVMEELTDLGNSLLVVEHDRSVMERADWIVELGPGGGHKGGELLFNGDRDRFLREAETSTAAHLRGERPVGDAVGRRRRRGRGWLTVHGASGHNLKNIDVSFPLGTLTCVTGVSGSGKTTLLHETVYPALTRAVEQRRTARPLPYRALKGLDAIRRVRLVDQSPIGKSPRSNPVTYVKTFDAIRKLFAGLPDAKRRGFSPGSFSFNVAGGRCEACRGEGSQKLEMYFFEDLYVACDECKGRRYRPEVLDVRYRGRDIHQVLEMTVDEACSHFSGEAAITDRLEQMRRVGIGYLKLGQPAPTLSGGEAQRLKLCAELFLTGGKETFYILDEPTTGLHFEDVTRLLKVLEEFVRDGHTVVVIEHNPDVIRQADWIIDLGPEGGEEGGGIVAIGPPEAIRACPDSHTGRYL